MSKLTLIEQAEANREGTVTGRAWIPEAILIKALVNRLGGKVTINNSELQEIGGVMFNETFDGMDIETDEYIGGK